MKKRITKVMSMGAVGMLSAGMIAGPALAAPANHAGANLTENGQGTTYTEASARATGNTIQFVKTLTMDSEAHVPNVQFKYTLDTPNSHTRDENATNPDVGNYGDDDASSAKEYISARVAVKDADGKVVYTELYSGGDTTKVSGQPLFKNNTESPARSTFEDEVTGIKVKDGEGGNTGANIVGGTTGVVTFFSGADYAHYDSISDTTKDTVAANTDKVGTQTGEQMYTQENETKTKTTLQNTTASGSNMKIEGDKRNSTGDEVGQGTEVSKDYVNGAGLAGQDLNNQNLRTTDVETGKKYAYANVELDFSGVSFNEPGIYRWYITETPSSDNYKAYGITDDEDNTRILDVYVVDQQGDNEGKLAIAGYVMHNEKDTELKKTGDSADSRSEDVASSTNGDTGTADGNNKAYDYSFEGGVFKSNVPNNAGSDLNSLNATKPDGFANDYDTKNLRIKKTVTGNQGSRDEYFRFEVVIKNGLPGCVYDINYAPTNAGGGLVGGTILNTDQQSNANTGIVDTQSIKHYFYATQEDGKKNINNSVALPINGADEGDTDKTGVNQTVHSNPTRLVANESGEVRAVIWLQHNQEIQISGLPLNSEYTVEEDKAEMDLEGYTTTTTACEISRDAASYPNAVTDTPVDVAKTLTNAAGSNFGVKEDKIVKDTEVEFTNDKHGIIPTAVLMTVIPGAIAVIGGGTGAAVLRMRKNRDEDDEI